jgi:ArsR family transcriptional regulator
VKQQPISDELLALMAEKFRMLSDPTRLAILRVLMHNGEKSVTQVVAETGHSVANVSKHLKQLATGGLLARRKEGPFVKYRLDDPVIEKICELVCDSLRRDLEEQQRKTNRALRQRKTGG